MITIQISLHSNVRGRGFWTLNTFLSDKEFVDQIKLVIAETKEEYEQDDNVDPNLVWKMIKMKVRETSIKYGAKKKNNLETKQIGIERIINQLEKQLADTCIKGKQKEKICTELQDKKRELEAYF